MDSFETDYDVRGTAEFIRDGGYRKVVLQFPDELLKNSARIARALKRELSGNGQSINVYVMADTAYNSCCIDEVGASYVSADCVVHYGHSCMSPTTTLPAFFVFGKAPIDVISCVESLNECLTTEKKPILVLCGLEYSYALENLEEAMVDLHSSHGTPSEVCFAKVCSSVLYPSAAKKTNNEQLETEDINTSGELTTHENGKFYSCDKLASTSTFHLGGLTWTIASDRRMDEYLIFWVGQDNSAFANIVLTFNNCEIVRYDAKGKLVLTDLSYFRKLLKRRYYLVEKAKDANIVGILVGTLGVAGYLHIIQKMKTLIEGAGKKAYTLVMGRPNSAKLANFPECDVFVYVSCAQTALLDSKDLLSPVITPYEALLAFSSGKQWTGEYMLDFRDLMSNISGETSSTEEARFSFLKGGYIEDTRPAENTMHQESLLALSEAAAGALSLGNQQKDAVLFKGSATSATEFLKARTYQGLSTMYESPLPPTYLTGRTGRAASYTHEKPKHGI